MFHFSQLSKKEMVTYGKFIFVVFIIVSSFFARSIIFEPIPIKEQLKTTDVIIHGHYERVHGYKKDDTIGMEFTEHSLQLISIAGINHQGRRQRFITLGGRTQEISGVPQFRAGEEVVLLLINTPHGDIIQHLSLGKYNVVDRNGRKFLVNSAFPKDNNLSNFSFEQFNKYVKERFGNDLEIVNNSVPINKENTKKSRIAHQLIKSSLTKQPQFVKKSQRKTASSNKVHNEESSSTFFWYLMASIVLVLLTISVSYFFTKASRN